MWVYHVHLFVSFFLRKIDTNIVTYDRNKHVRILHNDIVSNFLFPEFLHFFLRFRVGWQLLPMHPSPCAIFTAVQTVLSITYHIPFRRLKNHARKMEKKSYYVLGIRNVARELVEKFRVRIIF